MSSHPKLQSLALLALLVLTAPAGFAGPRPSLGWPLEQEPSRRRFSSSFCEFRGSHLHGGVDLSTEGEVGVPVLAVADGEVYRVKVKYRGLGRALYVRHADGLISVYGHLAGFAGPLGAWVDAEIAKRGRYPGDLWPDTPVRVLQGETIAWAGKTGGGPPHLHFETRRGGGSSPVDPFAEGLPCLDDRAPEFKELLLVPTDRAAELSLRPGSIPGTPRTAERLSLGSDAELRLAGRYRFLLRVEDPLAAGTGGVTRLKATIEGRTLIDLHADRFTYGKTGQVGLLMNRALSRTSPTEFWYWLHALPGNSLPFMSGSQALDSRSLPQDRRSVLLIEAADGCGNMSTVKIPIKAEAAQPEAPAPWRWLDGQMSGTTLAEAVASPGKLVEARADQARLRVGPGVVGEKVVVGLGRPGRVPASPDGPRLVDDRVIVAMPEGLPMKGKAKVLFELPPVVPGASQPPRQQLGLYRWNAARVSWSYWGADVQEPGWLGVSTDRLGVFALMVDEAPPQLVDVRRASLADRPWQRGGEFLTVTYSETGKGVAWDGVRLELAGSTREVIADHDPDLRQGVHRLPTDARGKRVEGTVILSDRAGNESRHPLSLAAIP